ncbi:MAG: hypothetical protein ACLUQJ_07285 [Alphaproteobacteria bacterium]
MKKLFIFDGDGVLLDLWGAMKSVYEQYTGTLLTTAEWDKVIIDFLHNPYPYAEFGRYFDASTTFGNLPPVKGMPELVNYAYSCGYNLAVITSVDNTETSLPDAVEISGSTTAISCLKLSAPEGLSAKKKPFRTPLRVTIKSCFVMTTQKI